MMIHNNKGYICLAVLIVSTLFIFVSPIAVVSAGKTDPATECPCFTEHQLSTALRLMEETADCWILINPESAKVKVQWNVLEPTWSEAFFWSSGYDSLIPSCTYQFVIRKKGEVFDQRYEYAHCQSDWDGCEGDYQKCVDMVRDAFCDICNASGTGNCN